MSATAGSSILEASSALTSSLDDGELPKDDKGNKNKGKDKGGKNNNGKNKNSKGEDDDTDKTAVEQVPLSTEDQVKMLMPLMLTEAGKAKAYSISLKAFDVSTEL
eukprot:4307328-Alexandrium_andersonii.AAC.1